MNNINYSKMPEEERDRRIEYGRKHLKFCTQLYEIQWQAGRYFLHEHPDTAISWGERCITNLLKKQGVVRVTGDQCMYGLKANDGAREGPAWKRTGFLTNSPCIAKRLELRCPNTKANQIHDHVVLNNGRATAAQIYPPALCRAVCQGLIEQLKVDRKGQFIIANVSSQDNDIKGMVKEAEMIKSKYKTIEEDNSADLEIAWDDVTGAELNPKDVRKARGEEIEYVRKMNLYTNVPIKQCYDRTGNGPISTRWIDINKGDSVNPPIIDQDW